MTVGHFQRVAAYAVVRDSGGRVLVTRESARSDYPGYWALPGGGVEHGEHPVDAVVREVREESGLEVRPVGLPRVLADVLPLAVPGTVVHTVRLVYDAEVTGGDLAHELDGSSDLAEFVAPEALAERELLPYAAAVLGLPEPPPPRLRAETVEVPVEVPAVVAQGAVRRQRLAAYGVAYDEGRLLVTQLAPHTGAPGAWTLPGGGVDHGEHPEASLAREFVEETGLEATVGELVGVYSHHFTGRAPSGVLEDFHGLRLVYGARVDGTRAPRVLDVGGTTVAAAWHPVDRVAELRTTSLVGEVLGSSRP
jgi:ADP-ribose pyrophosphatase YjhB (NUDIX family)